MNATNDDLRWVWLAAEVLLVATSVATIFMLQRIFGDDTFVAPLIFTLIVSHGVLIAMRWFGFGTATSALVSLLATGAAIVAVHYSGSSLAIVIPTSATVDQFQVDMLQARDLFQSLKAPVPPVPGFVVIASIGMWFLAFAADWAAFRLFAPGQALLPFIAMLIFVSLLGIEQDRLATTSTALICGVLFLLAHRAASRAAQGVWLDHGPGRGYVSLMAAGGVVALIAAAVGVLGGPAVPGANEAPLVEIGDEGRTESRPLEVISPLVQIQPRLIDQSDSVLFTVETNQSAYWRIAALDVFDGVLWRSQGQFRSAGDELSVGYPSSAPVNVVTQTFDLGELNVVWAPAAYLPTSFENLSGSGVNYESESATFIVDTKDQSVSDGLRYRVESQIPTFTADSLRGLANSGASGMDSVDARYLDLPADYSPLARAEAERITAGLTDDYSRALALQNYFRDNFTYDIDVAKGHDIRRLEDFLTVQRGYCEQFAGTYASMARAIGIPARVATGFTPGDPDPDNPDRFIVRGRHAHAWPEVFISGAGWVAFEPTPGRGAPNATDYTGVPESQETFEPPSLAETEAAEAAALAEEAETVPAEPTPTPQAQDDSASPTPAAAAKPVGDQTKQARPSRFTPLLLVVAAAVAWALGVPALKKWRVSRRAQAVGDDPRRRITLAWASTVDRLDAFGNPPADNETLQEYAHRIQLEIPTMHPAFGELTELTVEAAYRSNPPSEESAVQAESFAATLAQALDAEQNWRSRSVRGIDPRPLLRVGDRVVERAEALASGAV